MASRVDLRLWAQNASVHDIVAEAKARSSLFEQSDGTQERLGVLHHAAALGRRDLLGACFDRGMCVNMPSGAQETDAEEREPRWDPGVTLLMCAAAHAQIETMRFLLASGADPLRNKYYGGTALHYAAASGSVPAVNMLLASGCDTECIAGDKFASEELGFYWANTPLHVAANASHPAVARTLLGHGAAPDPLGMIDERRPLHYAAAVGAGAVAELLLRAGADPNRPDAFHGQTPLHYAVSGGHVACVSSLLRHGAESVVPQEGRARFHDLAADIFDADSRKAILKLLKSYGAESK